MTGKEWIAAFENVLQTAKPEWWDGKIKRMRRENLVLIRFPEQKRFWFCQKIKRPNINELQTILHAARALYNVPL